jgi:hypothetical protein
MAPIDLIVRRDRSLWFDQPDCKYVSDGPSGPRLIETSTHLSFDDVDFGC